MHVVRPFEATVPAMSDLAGVSTPSDVSEPIANAPQHHDGKCLPVAPSSILPPEKSGIPCPHGLENKPLLSLEQEALELSQRLTDQLQFFGALRNALALPTTPAGFPITRMPQPVQPQRCSTPVSKKGSKSPLLVLPAGDGGESASP